jgi:Phage P2 GpE
VIAEVAYTFHCGLGEANSLDLDELMEWHQQATRIHKQLHPNP